MCFKRKKKEHALSYIFTPEDKQRKTKMTEMKGGSIQMNKP